MGLLAKLKNGDTDLKSLRFGNDRPSGGDSGQSNSQAGADAAQEDDSAGYGGYAVGGIVRLRKNKQNSRIHDRRKRLAMGGIASLHG